MIRKEFYIMAGGKQTRWADDSIKQLAPVDDNRWPVIGRTIGMIQDIYDSDPVVVTNELKIKDFASRYGAPTSSDIAPTLCGSIFRGMPFWKAQTVIVLLGDVYYSAAALEMLVNGTKKPFIGNETELFGVRFDVADVIHWQSALLAVMEANHRNPAILGKLWNLYYYVSGYAISGRYHQFGPNLVLIEDITTDFDTIEEYQKFINAGKADLSWEK